MSLPFAFEPRPVDQIIPGRRVAYDTATCWDCQKPVDYRLLSAKEQAVYRGSFICPECFEEILAENGGTIDL